MFVIDADTSVAPDSLNRLVAACTDDSQIVGICGETRLENEQASWWTMIQGKWPNCGSYRALADPYFICFQSTSTSFLITWRKLSNLSSVLLPVFLDGELALHLRSWL